MSVKEKDNNVGSKNAETLDDTKSLQERYAVLQRKLGASNKIPREKIPGGGTLPLFEMHKRKMGSLKELAQRRLVEQERPATDVNNTVEYVSLHFDKRFRKDRRSSADAIDAILERLDDAPKGPGTELH